MGDATEHGAFNRGVAEVYRDRVVVDGSGGENQVVADDDAGGRASSTVDLHDGAGGPFNGCGDVV